MRKRPRRSSITRNLAVAGFLSPGDVKWSRVKWPKIDQTFAQFEPESLITLISAAADSPACGHRLPSLTVLWLRAVTHSPNGTVIARPPHLAALLVDVLVAAPQLQHVEDCWNADPRLDVRFPVGNVRLRFHPGALSDPVQLLRIVESTAAAIDTYILDHYGFSLSDLLDVSLRYSDRRIGLLSKTWSTERLPRDDPDPNGEYLDERARRISGSPSVILQEEIDAACSISVVSDDWIFQCAHPDRAAAAWEWSTASSRNLQLTLEPMMHSLGTTLSIRSGDHVRPVPASLVLGALAASTALFANEAAADPRSAQALDLLTVQRVIEIFGMDAPLSISDEPSLKSAQGQATDSLGLGLIVVPTNQHAYAIAVVSGLDARGLAKALKEADAILSEMTVEQLSVAGPPIDPTGTIHRLVLYGGPLQQGPPRHAGIVHLHVEDLATIKLDAQQFEAGPDLIFQFLDELTTMPGIEELLVMDFSDIWRHWRTEGVLNPTGVSGIAFAVDCRQDDAAWLTAASWEPIEAVLTAAGLPPVSTWHTAHLDERGHATLGTNQQSLYLILVDPPIIVNLSLTGGLSDLGFDPLLGIGMVDGMLLTCANFPGVANGFALANQEPLTVFMEFSSERQPGLHEDEVAIGVRTVIDPRPAIGLLLGPDWLEMLNRDPYEAHRALGRAIVHCLDELGNHAHASVWDETRRHFLSEWDAAPPVVMVHFQETTLKARHKGQVSLPRSHATEGRARRLLAIAVLEDGLSPCKLFGKEAREVCQSRIVPAMDRALERVVAEWSEDALLKLAEHLNDAHAERARAETELAMALSAPWADRWRSLSLEARDPSEQTRPLEFLLEILLSEHLAGSVSPDRFAIAEAVDLALEVIKIGVSLSGAERGLNDLAVVVGSGGMTRVAAGPSFEVVETESGADALRITSEIDTEAYLKAQRAHQLRIRAFADLQDSVDVRLDEERIQVTSPFVPFESIELPGSLRSADRAMLAQYGTGLSGLMAVLGTAGSWTSAGDAVELVPLSDLRDAAVAWSSLPIEQIDAALDRLILSGEALRNEGLRYWELEKRRVRLTTRPLVQVDNKVIVVPWLIHATQGIYLRYLLEGRLPWHSTDIPKSVREAFNDYRQVLNRSLERLADTAVEKLDLPHKRNILERDAAALGLQLPGELDLLIADPARSRIWVCEVKDVSAAFSPRTIRNRIDKFTDDDGYVNDLLAREVAVRNNPEAAAKLIAAPAPNRPWRVIPLMVTRDVEPAAFKRDVSVTFTVVDDLPSVLLSEADPPFGHSNLES